MRITAYAHFRISSYDQRTFTAFQSQSQSEPGKSIKFSYYFQEYEMKNFNFHISYNGRVFHLILNDERRNLFTNSSKKNVQHFLIVLILREIHNYLLNTLQRNSTGLKNSM